MNTYWPVYKNLEKSVEELTFSIHVDDQQMNVYSSKIKDLILRAAIEIETLAKDLYHSHKGPKKAQLTYDDALKFLNQKWLLEKKVVFISSPNCFQTQRIIFPFLKDETRTGKKRKTYGWNNAYQNLKHDRNQNIGFGSIYYLFQIMSALYLLNVYYKNEAFDLGQSSAGLNFDSNLGSILFSIQIAKSVNNDKDGNRQKEKNFDECAYFFDMTEKTKTAMSDSMKKHNATFVDLLGKHPKFIEYVQQGKNLAYKGKNMPWDALGKDEYIRLMQLTMQKSPINWTSEYVALLNKNQI